MKTKINNISIGLPCYNEKKISVMLLRNVYFLSKK